MRDKDSKKDFWINLRITRREDQRKTVDWRERSAGRKAYKEKVRKTESESEKNRKKKPERENGSEKKEWTPESVNHTKATWFIKEEVV